MDSSAYLSQLIGLLPPGDALAREPGSRLERLLSVPAAELARADGRVEALLLESDPARTTEMLTDWERALGLPDICYPNFQFSRASSAWYFDGAGTLREAAVDEPRYSYDALGQRTEAVLVEAAAVNGIRNVRCAGVVPGTPGTPPTHWIFVGVDGVAFNMVGSGTEGGIPYVDVRLSGTSTTGASPFLREDTLFPTAEQNEIWTHSAFVRLVGGALTGIQSTRIFVTEWTAASVFVTQGFTAFTTATGALAGGRISNTRTLTGATTGRVGTRIDLVPAIGVAIDATIRIGAPQLERGAVATSPILNPVGTPAVTTRAADNLYIATTEERRARILARLIERFEPTPAAIIGLAARLGDTVTVTEFRPHHCEFDCEAPVLDEPWAHAFQVSGASQHVVEATCQDTCEMPLSQWRTGAYECAIRRFAPAQTIPIFTYA